jgi:hypothetical protein
MRRVFSELWRLLAPDGKLIVIAGDVRLRRHQPGYKHGSTFKVGNALANLLASSPLPFEIQETIENAVPTNQRYFHALSASLGHSKRPLVERIVIAVKKQMTNA